MRKSKLKILKHSIRKLKELWIVLHIRVYCKEGKSFTAVHLFDSAKFV